MKTLSKYNFDQLTPVSAVPSQKNILKEQGNIKIEALYKIITKKNGAPDLLAIDIYLEARSWFKPKKAKVDGNVIYSSKLKGHGWQIGYEYFVKKYRCSSDLIRTKFVLLEKLGLLTRKFTTEYFYGKRFNNLMHLLVWKDTPHFYSETGLEKPLNNTPENQGHLCLNSRTPILENKDNIYVIPNNHPIEELESSKSFLCSSFKETPVIEGDNTRVREGSKNAPCANGSFDEPAQDDFSHETKDLNKATQLVTVCNQLNKQQYPRLLTAKEEKERHLQRMQRNPENEEESSFAELMSKVLYHAQPEEQTTQVPANAEQTLAYSSFDESAKGLTSIDHLRTKGLETKTEIVMKQEKITEITNEQSNKMLLSKAIFNAFGDHVGNEIQDNCEFRFLAPDKLSIKIKDGFLIEEHQKAGIRGCIKSVYGENIKLVADICKPLVIPTPSLASTVNHTESKNATGAVVSAFPQDSMRSAKWLKFKAHLAKCFNVRNDTKYSEYIIKHWYDKLRISSESNENMLVLVGSGCVIDRINQDYFARTEEAVLSSGVNIELHYECNQQKPIVISKATISR